MTLTALPSLRSTSSFLVDEQARLRNAIARQPVFQGLEPEVINQLARRVTTRRVLGGSTVFRQDEPGDGLYIVATGRVKVVVQGDNGREVTLSVLRTGDLFGEMSLFDESKRSASVVAIDPTTLIMLPRAEVEAHMAAHPQTALRLLAELTRKLRRADETIAEMALCDVSERLIRKLVGLAKEEGGEQPEGFVMRRRPTQQDLANMVGSCRETVSRAINSLARKGLIVAKGRGLVVTRRLVEMAEPAPQAA